MRPFSWQRYASPNPKLPPKYPSQHECFLATHFITRWDTVVFFPPHLTQQPQVGQCFYIIEASLSHSDTPHSTGFLWIVISPTQVPLYLTTHNTHKKQTSTTAAGFEPATTVSKLTQTHASDRPANGIATVVHFPLFMTALCLFVNAKSNTLENILETVHLNEILCMPYTYFHIFSHTYKWNTY